MELNTITILLVQVRECFDPCPSVSLFLQAAYFCALPSFFPSMCISYLEMGISEELLLCCGLCVQSTAQQSPSLLRSSKQQLYITEQFQAAAFPSVSLGIPPRCGPSWPLWGVGISWLRLTSLVYMVPMPMHQYLLKLALYWPGLIHMYAVLTAYQNCILKFLGHLN